MSTMDEIRASRAALAGERLRGTQHRQAEIKARFRERLASDDAAERSRACRWKLLADIEVELTDGGGPATYMDWNIACLRAQAVGIGPHTSEQVTPAYATNLADARQFVWDVLPGFWITSGLCDLTGHASLGPDYNGPDRERLMREWPDDDRQCRNGWDEDLAPAASRTASAGRSWPAPSAP